MLFDSRGQPITGVQLSGLIEAAQASEPLRFLEPEPGVYRASFRVPNETATDKVRVRVPGAGEFEKGFVAILQ